ncbi:hypothetical protein AKJ16_DCAP00149 [Drosera capensis]
MYLYDKHQRNHVTSPREKTESIVLDPNSETLNRNALIALLNPTIKQGIEERQRSNRTFTCERNGGFASSSSDYDPPLVIFSLPLRSLQSPQTKREVYAVSIVGPFPIAVTNLLDLTWLNLRWNKLQDVLPPEIGELKSVTHLDVGNNHLVGTIRELIRIEGCFPALRNLYIEGNAFRPV